jgi:hypothetical protein
LVEKIENLKKKILSFKHYEHIVSQQSFADRVKISALVQSQLNSYDIMKEFGKYWEKDQESQSPLFVYKEEKKKVFYNTEERIRRIDALYDKCFKKENEETEIISNREQIKDEFSMFSIVLLGYVNLLYDFYVQNKQE